MVERERCEELLDLDAEGLVRMRCVRVGSRIEMMESQVRVSNQEFPLRLGRRYLIDPRTY